MNDARHPDRHFIVGVIVLALGVILLLDQLGLWQVTKFWPLILIYFGVNKLTTRHDMNGRFWGGFLTLLGIAFQLQELGYSRVRFETIWPVFLICIGVLLLLRRYEARRWSDYYGPPPPSPVPPGPPTPDSPSSNTAPSEPAASSPQAEPTASSSSSSTDAPPQSVPGSGQQIPPQPNAAPGWDQQWWRWNPPQWQGDPARQQRFNERMKRRMERFDARMNRFNEQWQQRQSTWESRQSHWQPNSNWCDSSEPRLNDVNVFWGGRRRIISKNFMGGEIVAIFGGFEIDLRQADFQGDQIAIEVVTIFGGGEIRVPTSWEVVVDSVGIFGGTGDRTNHPAPPSQTASGSATPPVKRLNIKGVSIFGGLTLKN